MFNDYVNICKMCKCIPPNFNTVNTLLNPNDIAKFITELSIPEPMPYDVSCCDNEKKNFLKGSVRKINQQILPPI